MAALWNFLFDTTNKTLKYSELNIKTKVKAAYNMGIAASAAGRCNLRL